jgi:hypothetical protein
MAPLNINIPQPNKVEDTATNKPAKKAVAPITVPSIDLDALLKKVKETKPESAGKGRAPSQLATQVGEVILQLVERATANNIASIPLGPVVREVAIQCGVEPNKKSQYFYTLSQSIMKVLGERIKIYKEGRSSFVICDEKAFEATQTEPAE